MPNNMQLIDYLSMCIMLPISAPACYSFWETVMYASATTGLLLAGWFAWKLVDHKRKPAVTLSAVQEQEKPAKSAVMRPPARNEPADIAADVTDPHLAKKIRQELEQQRLKNLRP
jgi:hypothetical protein